MLTRLPCAVLWKGVAITNKAVIRFSILKIPVCVDAWFWVSLAFIGGGLSASSSEDVFNVLLFVFAGFLSILIHELGHALTIRMYGLPSSITLQAFGGFASYPAGRLNRIQSFCVSAAGPIVQLALGLCIIILSPYLAIPEGSLFVPFSRYLVWVSVVWAIFNCLPVYPMDGGQMLAALMGKKRQHYVHLIGVFFALAFALVGYSLFGSILLLVFMAFFAWQNWQAFRAITR